MEEDFSDEPSWVPSEGQSLSDLIARVDAATGANRELDRAIATWQFPHLAECERWPHGGWHSPAWGLIAPPEHYTASIDAALALVERVLPGWFVGLQQNRWVGDERRWTAYITLDADEHEATTYTPALALLAALLRALQAQPIQHNARDGSSPINPPTSEASRP